ncbi:MAG: hypothetical protein NT130_00995 [Candidatus Micrarchaeota archaeon]|nr:hypothetical protein [Candidatus Micrarchaeota archaeon]
MKYQIIIFGLLFSFVGFLLESKAYDFVCGCSALPSPQFVNEADPCYQCINSTKYQNSALFFQILMIVGVFIVLYGFFSDFEYQSKKSSNTFDQKKL